MATKKPNPKPKVAAGTMSLSRAPAAADILVEQKKSRKLFFKDRKMMEGSGKLLEDIDVASGREVEEVIRISNSKFVASYNWKDSDEPIIFVPGSPARWNPPILPFQAAKDNGTSFIDQNSHRSPSASFDPFFKALLTMHPTFDMKPVGLVTDRNSLRKLFQFVSSKVDRSWRIDVDIIEDTLFFSRWEESKVQIITGSFQSGYGHEFEKAYLNYELSLQESSSHHRIIAYNLGGIDCMIRYEADGHIGEAVEAETATDNKTTLDELGKALSDLRVQDSANATTHSAVPRPTEVKVNPRGRLIDHQAILELKSRSGSMNSLQPYIPQLWISQTRHLFVAHHKEGLIKQEPRRVNMDEHFPAWEDKNQEHLKSLVGLIEKIKEIAKRTKDGKCMVVCKKEEKSVLKMYTRSGKDFFLPEGVRKTCWGS